MGTSHWCQIISGSAHWNNSAAASSKMITRAMEQAPTWKNLNEDQRSTRLVKTKSTEIMKMVAPTKRGKYGRISATGRSKIRTEATNPIAASKNAWVAKASIPRWRLTPSPERTQASPTFKGVCNPAKWPLNNWLMLCLKVSWGWRIFHWIVAINQLNTANRPIQGR